MSYACYPHPPRYYRITTDPDGNMHCQYSSDGVEWEQPVPITIWHIVQFVAELYSSPHDARLKEARYLAREYYRQVLRRETGYAETLRTRYPWITEKDGTAGIDPDSVE